MAIREIVIPNSAAGEIGVFVPALVMGSLLTVLHGRFGFGPGRGLEAPQATVMKTLVEGMMTGHIPLVGIGWALILGIPGLYEWHEGLTEGGWRGTFAPWGSLLIFGVLAGTLWWAARRSRGLRL
ncbi:MAG: hypothetical protein ACK4Z6_04625 [Candidatus Methylomirabilales bacterium]